MSAKDKAWYEEWFGHDYLEVYSHRNATEAAKEIDNFERLIKISKNLPVLDLACGNGRHSIELAKRGYEVTGLDLSGELLAVARKNARKNNLSIQFVQADMRHPPTEKMFGTVLNMFTSFGYFPTDEENAEIMDAIYRVLVPEGTFLIDYINRDHVLKSLVPFDEKSVSGKQIKQYRTFDQASQRLNKKIVIISAGEEKVFSESVRLFKLEEMIHMAKNAGLEIDTIYGEHTGRKHSPNSPRAIFVGRKPES